MGVLTDIVGMARGKGRKKPGAGAGASDSSDASTSVPTYHRGGTVRKTGLARLKKGEQVLTKSQARKRSRGKRR